MQPFILLSITMLAFSAFAQRDGLRVSTQQGDVSGSFSAPEVRQFLGVPYATAKRWQNPTLPPERNQVLNATAFGDSCPQLLDATNLEFNRVAWTFNRDNESFVPQSEDCLTVNIWSPSVNRKQATAVLFWIHGGGFVWGTSRLPIYNGTNLVRDNDDITIVSFNYRLNIFAWPNAPQLVNPSKTQNFGLLDLDAAVKWVHDNIANFGGDPNRITLFGQSAGAVLADAYALAHPDDTIVKGQIQQSGSTFSAEIILAAMSPTGVLPRINTSNWNVISDLVGCGSSPSAAQFNCMERVPTGTLEDAVIKNDVWFVPVQDDITYFHDPKARTAVGKYLNVPLLQGTTRDENDAFVIPAELVSSRGIVVPMLSEILSDLNTANGFFCSLRTITTAHLQAKHRIFNYQYQAVLPNLSLQPSLRAFHGAEIHLVFGTYNNSPIASTANEVALSKYIQSVWVGFARDPERGLSELGWPQYNPTKPTYGLLGGLGNETGATFVDPRPFGIICENATLLLESILAFQRL